MTTKKTFQENVLRVIAVLGLIAVLLLGAWGIIQLAFIIPSFLSNLAGGVPAPSAKESLSVSLPLSVTAAQAFPVSWSHKNSSGQYAYTLSYSCADGLSAKAPLPNGTAQAVSCDTPFNYINATNTTPLIFTLTGTKNTPVTLTVAATKLSTGAVTSTGTANTTVFPSPAPAEKTPVKTPAKTPATKYVASVQPRPALYGSPDLQVRMLSNPGTVRAGSQVSLQFVVENVGTNVVPANWIFIATLPYSPAYTYQSPAQQALYPGDKIIYTLGYTAVAQNNTPVCTMQYPNYNCPTTPPPTPYNPSQTSWTYPYSTLDGYSNSYYPNQGYGTLQSASVAVDPYNIIWESNESNNTAGISYQVY